jgi:4-hydroxy-2-oxoheptanedioate aldolase
MLGSPLTGEILAQAGLDWVIIDLEHGVGGEWQALAQVQALAHTSTAPLVRVESNERPRFHRALDMGAAGVLVPRVESADEARLSVSYCRYGGLRGIDTGSRAWRWGFTAGDHFDTVDEENVCAIQIETLGALHEAREIAAVDGVDVLFLGPFDLSNALGLRGQPSHPKVLEAAKDVADAAAAAGKVAGVSVGTVEQAAAYHDLGYTFLSAFSDTDLLALGARQMADAFRALE